MNAEGNPQCGTGGGFVDPAAADPLTAGPAIPYRCERERARAHARVRMRRGEAAVRDFERERERELDRERERESLIAKEREIGRERERVRACSQKGFRSAGLGGGSSTPLLLTRSRLDPPFPTGLCV